MAAVLLVPPLLRIMSFARLERLLVRATRWRLASAPDDADSARWVDDRLMGLPQPWTYTCLRRATILYYLLSAAGRAVTLCIGVRRDEHGVLHAHAWLLRDDAVYLEAAASERIADFSEIARFPHAAPAAQPR